MRTLNQCFELLLYYKKIRLINDFSMRIRFISANK